MHPMRRLGYEALPGISLFGDLLVIIHALASVEHSQFRMPLNSIVCPERSAKEADAIDDDEFVLKEVHIRELCGGGVAVVESFPDRASTAVPRTEGDGVRALDEGR